MLRTSLKRDFLQLCQTYDPAKHNVGGWFISEKLDGSRCLWDGGLSRGLATEKVPWANVIDPKTGERKKKIKPIATGLWSRYGNVVMAPDWFLNKLPRIVLDGELFAGRGNFQLGRSICSGDTPDPRFDQIKYMIYSSPAWESLFSAGMIKNSNFHLDVRYSDCLAFIEARQKALGYRVARATGGTFSDELLHLGAHLFHSEVVQLHLQTKLATHGPTAAAQVEEFLDKVIANGGEGIVLRHPEARWTPKRIAEALKYKPFQDDEGELIGYTAGEEGKTGNRLGKIGALILDYHGHRLKLAGLNADEQEFYDESTSAYALKRPGQDMPPGTKAKHFLTGEKITFIYRELSDDGIPKEARYLRARDEE